MRKKIIGLALAVAALSGLGMSAAQAVPDPETQAVGWESTWHPYTGPQTAGVSYAAADVRDYAGRYTFGTLSVGVDWEYQYNTNHTDYRWRPRNDGIYADISIINRSKEWVILESSGKFEVPGLAWTRLKNPVNGKLEVSTYIAPGQDSTIYLPPNGSASILSVDNPSRWFRVDGVPDSDASPFNSPISNMSDPAFQFEFRAFDTSADAHAASRDYNTKAQVIDSLDLKNPYGLS